MTGGIIGSNSETRSRSAREIVRLRFTVLKGEPNPERVFKTEVY